MAEAHKIDFRYAPPSTWTNIGLVDDPFKTVVREDGALMYGFESIVFSCWQFRRVFEFGIQASRGPQSVEQVTETPLFPCVVTVQTYARASLELRAFAHQQGDRRTDIVLWKLSSHPGCGEVLTALKIDIFELKKVFTPRSTRPGRVIFGVDPDSRPTPEGEFTGEEEAPVEENSDLPGIGEPVFVSTQPLQPISTTGFRPGTCLAAAPCILKEGESVSGALIFPLNYTDMVGLDLGWAETAYRQARQYWEEAAIMRLPIQVPDPDLMAMIVASARNILQAREIEDGLPVFKVGPTVYRNLFVVDGHFLLEAATYLGLQEDAYRGVDTLLRRVRSDGSISEMSFHSKETGISIFTLIRQCELAGDDERLRTLWPIIQNGVGYIEALRQKARELPQDHPCFGLMPPAYADGGIGGIRGEYTTVVWTLAGLKAAAYTAARLGITGDAARFQADFDSLFADFRTHAARDSKSLADGTRYLAMWKPGFGDHNWVTHFPPPTPAQQKLTPVSGTWALCQAVYPGEVFAPDDPLLIELLGLYDYFDDDEGIPAFTGWLPYQSLWTYNASFGAHAWLYAGRADKAVDYLYAFANHASPTRVWREEQSLKSSEHGQIFGDMPHNWASAEFIRLVRHLFVFEVGGGLHLFHGLPRDWRLPNTELALERTPTRYGPVILRLKNGAEGFFNLYIETDAAWKRKPDFMRIHLAASQLRLQGQPVQLVDGSLDLPVGAVLHLEGIWSGS
jgi:hypothetical protein